MQKHKIKVVIDYKKNQFFLKTIRNIRLDIT